MTKPKKAKKNPKRNKVGKTPTSKHLIPTQKQKPMCKNAPKPIKVPKPGPLPQPKPPKPPKPVKIKHTKEYTHEDCPGPGWNFKTVFCLKTLYVHHKMKKTANGFSKRGCFKCVHFQKDEEAKKRGEEGCSGCMWPKCPRYHPGLYFSEIAA